MATLIYQAGFRHLPSGDPVDPGRGPTLRGVTDVEHLGPLHEIRSPVQPGDDGFDIMQPEAIAPGLKLTLTRGKPVADTNPVAGDRKDNCYVGGAVRGIPTDLRYFRVTVTFEQPTWEPIAGDYNWAAVLFAREKGASYPTRDQRTTVTLGSSSQATVTAAKLNVPGGAPPGVEPPFPGNAGVAMHPIDDRLRKQLYESDNRKASTFTLEMFVDRELHIARASLDARILEDSGWVAYRQNRWFRHPLILDGAREIDTLGFALAIANGLSTATIVVRDFRIYRLNEADSALIRSEGDLDVGASDPFER